MSNDAFLALLRHTRKNMPVPSPRLPPFRQDHIPDPTPGQLEALRLQQGLELERLRMRQERAVTLERMRLENEAQIERMRLESKAASALAIANAETTAAAREAEARAAAATAEAALIKARADNLDSELVLQAEANKPMLAAIERQRYAMRVAAGVAVSITAIVFAFFAAISCPVPVVH